MLHRALIKTHHMTSRKKIQAIARAAKTLSCAVVIKTGSPPGVMMAECEGEGEGEDGNQGADEKNSKEGNGKKRVPREGEKRLREWVSVVKRLRYKDFQLLALEPISHLQPHSPSNPPPHLPIPYGRLEEFTEMKSFRTYLDECRIFPWWTARMGYPGSGG